MFMQITDGYRSEFSLSVNEQRYFIYELSSFWKKAKYISLTVTSLSGHASLSVCVKDNLHERYPIFHGHSDWSTNENSLQISIEDI